MLATHGLSSWQGRCLGVGGRPMCQPRAALRRQALLQPLRAQRRRVQRASKGGRWSGEHSAASGLPAYCRPTHPRPRLPPVRAARSGVAVQATAPSPLEAEQREFKSQVRSGRTGQWGGACLSAEDEPTLRWATACVFFQLRGGQALLQSHRALAPSTAARPPARPPTWAASAPNTIVCSWTC